MIRSQWKKMIAKEEEFKESVMAEHRQEPPMTRDEDLINAFL